jgi:type I restriction enzyme S subunit
VIAALKVPIPPLNEQRAIADYLDHETARMDALVAVKERQLALLAEKRRALVTRAVTRGLDPAAPLRDSRIPWLGEIPTQWGTRKLAWLFRERDERGEPELPLLEVSINYGVVLREFSDERIESTAADFNTYKVARRDDVVFNKMRMWLGGGRHRARGRSREPRLRRSSADRVALPNLREPAVPDRGIQRRMREALPRDRLGPSAPLLGGFP